MPKSFILRFAEEVVDGGPVSPALGTATETKKRGDTPEHDAPDLRLQAVLAGTKTFPEKAGAPTDDDPQAPSLRALLSSDGSADGSASTAAGSLSTQTSTRVRGEAPDSDYDGALRFL